MRANRNYNETRTNYLKRMERCHYLIYHASATTYLICTIDFIVIGDSMDQIDRK